MTKPKHDQPSDPAKDNSEIKIRVVDDASPSQPENDSAPSPSAAEGGTTEKGEGVVDVEKALAEARNEAKQNYDRLLRSTAELENFKKRSAREMADFKKFANESLIKALLPVIDSLELAIQSSPTAETSCRQVVEGVSLTLTELTKILEGFGVKAIAAEGQPFDPKFHQAFVQEENDNLPENTVIKEFQKGYLLNERLIRPAMVIVSKKSGAVKDGE
jgi:molecular chaperone GrpE